MGCAQSGQDDDGRKTNRDITNQLRESNDRAKAIKKILLLGAGESGKSTVLKQMKVIYLDSYTMDEQKAFVYVIHNNILESMRILVQHALTREGARFPASFRPICDQIILCDPTKGINPQLAEGIDLLWKSEPIQTSFAVRSTFQLNDNTPYFLDKVKECSALGYLPSVQDILNSRVRTTGIIELEFTVEESKFHMFDVGGQRNERRKWIHCFDNVDAVLFVVALSEYDQTLFEDHSTNRMDESFNVFSEICNSRFFTRTDIILFLNKRDLFAKKIQTTDLCVCFPKYTGGKNYDAALEYVTEYFKSCNKEQSRTIFTHVTCATDTNNIRFVFQAVKTSVFLKNMQMSGMV